MIDIIISYLVEKNISMSVNLADTIATTISETFISELKETYFVRNSENKCPKGKLYSKYFNKMRNLKNHGLVPQEGICKKSKNANKNLTRVTAELDDELIAEEDAFSTISHLKHDDLSWPDVESAWKKTSVYRLKALKNSNFSYTEIQTTWVHYTKPLGYKLIDIDFQRLYQNAKDMLSVFDNTSTKLVQILNERVKDPTSRKLIASIIENSNSSENSRNSVIFYVLHAMLVPTSKTSYIDSEGKRCVIKYSISDSQQSYVLIAQTAAELEALLNSKKVNGNSIQPCLLIVGTISEPSQIMVYFDNIKYKVFSIVRAIDICFKIFHVFNLEYPIQSLDVWLFIQKFYFNIVSKYDKPCPLVNQIISELK
eukprot:XP_016656983.1 PREDICTED: uncharacterized protein LOC107882702 [Acyrthosiphon pisum]